jgi:hypothetical protein
MGKGEENEIYRPTLPDDDESPLGPLSDGTLCRLRSLRINAPIFPLRQNYEPLRIQSDK